MIIDEIRKKLFSFQEKDFREFQAKLMPTVDKESIIGVRTPVVKSLAKEYAKRPEISEFLSDIPHKYFDEYTLHGFIIAECKDFELTVKLIDEFMPYVNNWATCDQTSPKIFKKNTDKLKPEILRWIKSDKTYVIRFGIEMAMSFYLDDKFDIELTENISRLRSNEYYVNMMIAWYFATALTKQWESAVKFIENNSLDVWTHNKAIQKAIESYRITDDQKAYLKGLKIKK